MPLPLPNDTTSLRHGHKEALILTDCPWAVKPLWPPVSLTGLFLGVWRCTPGLKEQNSVPPKGTWLQSHQTATGADGLQKLGLGGTCCVIPQVSEPPLPHPQSRGDNSTCLGWEEPTAGGEGGVSHHCIRLGPRCSIRVLRPGGNLRGLGGRVHLEGSGKLLFTTLCGTISGSYQQTQLQMSAPGGGIGGVC